MNFQDLAYYLMYIVVAGFIVFLSIKASKYVDLIEKKTSLSGAFIGGVMLSAVTSLPELFTSLTATIVLDEPGLCIGNILGSNLFNLTVLAVLVLVFFKDFANNKIARSQINVTVFGFLLYIVVLLNMLGFVNQVFYSISLTSVLIVALYILGVKSMSAENGSSESADEDTSPLSVKTVVIRLIITSVVLVGASVVLTNLTDGIAEKLNLGSGLAGALFLGIATSLPELASTVTLFKLKSYNIAVGNIVGSNLFNFIILSIADFLYFGKGVYDFSDPATLNLLVFGMIATPLVLVIIKIQNKYMKAVSAVGVAICYLAFLIV